MDKRARFRLGLSTLYLPYYDALCEELPEAWQPYSGPRTFDEQQALYTQGRGRPGATVTNAKAGESPHNYGCATDWCCWYTNGVPYWPDKLSPQWQTYIDVVEKVGLKGGYGWGDYPHNELWVDCGWKHVLLVYTQTGMTGAQNKIQCSLHQPSGKI